MKEMKNEKEVMDLEYDLVCQFVKLRNELGLTQAQMAEDTGVIREMISILEHGKRHPQVKTLIKLLEPYGYTLSITKIKKNK